jgi:hypothetical protein
LFIIALTVVVALIMRRFGLQLGVRHDVKSKDARAGAAAGMATAPTTH